MNNVVSIQQGGDLTRATREWHTRPADQRYETIEELLAVTSDRRMKSRSQKLHAGELEVVNQPVETSGASADFLLVKGKTMLAEPTNWSFGQLCTQAKAPASYLRQLPTALAVANLRHGLQDADECKFMSVKSDDGIDRLQAVTGPNYGRIWDADVVTAAQRIIERSNGKFYNPKDWSGKGSGLYASDRDCFLFLIDGGSILDAGPRAQLNRGFFMWNSEVGSRSFGICTFLFNLCCGNHQIWGGKDATTVLIRHTSGGPGRFDGEAMPALRAFVEAPAQPLIDQVKRAQDYLIPMSSGKTADEAVKEFIGSQMSRVKFTKGEVDDAIKFAKAEEGDCRTLWQLTQGFTASARSIDWVDARIDLEKRAGKLISLVE